MLRSLFIPVTAESPKRGAVVWGTFGADNTMLYIRGDNEWLLRDPLTGRFELQGADSPFTPEFYFDKLDIQCRANAVSEISRMLARRYAMNSVHADEIAEDVIDLLFRDVK